MHAGTSDLKTRWVEDKAIKECGWPAHIVKELLKERALVESWGLLQQSLNRILLGRTEDDAGTDSTDHETVDEEELQAYDARFVDQTHLVVPLPVAPMQLHIIFPTEKCTIPLHGEPPGMYITSTTIASYIRLHMLSELLWAFLTNTLIDPGESVIMAAIRFLEEQWASVEDNGPPDMSHFERVSARHDLYMNMLCDSRIKGVLCMHLRRLRIIPSILPNSSLELATRSRRLFGHIDSERHPFTSLLLQLGPGEDPQNCSRVVCDYL